MGRPVNWQRHYWATNHDHLPRLERLSPNQLHWRKRIPQFAAIVKRRRRAEAMDVASSLPDDVLAAVLRRLPPRGLAQRPAAPARSGAARVVDSRRLLRADLLPLSLAGILLNYDSTWFTQFLSRPTAAAAVSCRLDYTVPPPPAYIYVKDHCNGLLLLLREECRLVVVNPATRQWELLPPPHHHHHPLPPAMGCGL